MKYNRISDIKVTPHSFHRFDELPQFKITHDFSTSWMVWILLEGEILYSIEGGGEHTLRSGELLIIPPYYNVNKTALGEVSICFIRYFTDRNLPRIPLGVPVIPINARIDDDLKLLFKCESDSAYKNTLLMDIWFQLCLLYKEPAVPADAPKDMKTTASLLEYIDASLDKKLTLDSLAKYSDYSKSALIAQFRAQTGMTPMQYIIDRRIDLAKRLITSNRPLREIAAICGFANEFYLSSVFKRHTGMSPSEYRRRYV